MHNQTELQTPGSPGAPLARLRGALTGVVAAAILLAGLPWAAASAQDRGAARTTYITDDNGTRVPLRAPSGFNLFSEADVAVSGMRMTGTYGWEFPNVGGPCPWYYTNNSERCGQVVNQAGNWTDSFFEYGLAAGVPISDFRKIRTVYPGINNMKAPLGYSVAYRFTLAAPASFRLGAADGQFGSYYSGVTSTEDGSCKDHSSNLSGRVPAGLTLTAGSDCPETWSSAGFQGQHLITAESWLARAQSNPGGFRFDSWRVPASEQDPTFLGDFQTYGAYSDYYREILQRFGSVTPQGAGASSERGFPMGLEFRYDAWQYSRPSIRNVVWYQITVVNKSAAVYGTGVDYDSLYLALTPGFLLSSSPNQATSMYFDYQRNAVIAPGSGQSGRCSTTYPFRTAASGGCTNTRRFADGANAFIILKSPMGDTRNKLFTRAGSPFSALNVPDNIKDDTITFNHGRSSGFGTLANNFMNRNDKAFFGYMASIEDVFLDGRTASDFTPATAYRHFMGEQWRNFTGTLTSSFLRFPRFVPGSTTQPATNPKLPHPGQPYGKWDYNNDGIQDTIFVPGCGSAGCHDVYSDTIAGGTNNVYGNVANIIGMGPIKLKAGDTTQILIAMAGSSDSLQFEASINAAVDTYLNFYAGPAAIPAPRLTSADIQVTSAEVRDVTAGASTAQIRLRIPDLQSSADAYIQKVADQLANGTTGTIERLKRFNPNLLAQVQARARNNLAEILVFKSCDKGATFTTQSYNASTGAGCAPALARDPQGRAIGFGWQAFRTIPVDTSNAPGARFITDVVQAGRSYLYSFVTRTRGLIDIPVVDSIAPGVRAPTTLAQALALDADTIVSSLARSGPSTVTVYAPISLPAGTVAATLDTQTIAGLGTTRITADQTGGELVTGTYRLYFANRFIVTTTQNVSTSAVTNTSIVAQRVVRGATINGTTRDTALVADQRTFTAAGPVFGAPRTNLVSTVGGVRTYVDTLKVAVGDTTGYILARTAGGVERALFISLISRSTSTVNAGTTTAFENVSYFPGFRLTFEAPQSGINVPRVNVVVRAEGDTIDRTVVANNGVIPIAAASSSQTLYYSLGGTYQLQWVEDSWGPGANFTYRTPEQLTADVTASLAARPSAQVTDSTDALRKIVALRAAASGQDTVRPLVKVQLPFKVIGSTGTQATVAMFRRWSAGTNATRDSIVNNSRLLGNGGDTVRVPVPRNLWMPGDTLYVVETVKRDSTILIGGVLTTVTGPQTIDGRTAQVPIQKDSTLVSARLVLSCAGTTTPTTTASPRCNPLVPGTFAATGYLPYENGWKSVIDYGRSFGLFSEFELQAQAATAVGVQLTKADLDDIRVVPNPYIVQSSFDNIQGTARAGTPRVLFTGVPVQGILRVYSISGQMLQQVTWTQADLQNIGQGALTGDLPFTLRTREGLDLGSGLYVFVLQSTGTGQKLTKRGKFVVIR